MDALAQGRDGDIGRYRESEEVLGSCDTQSSAVHYNTFTQTHQKDIPLQLRGILPACRAPLGGVQLARLSLDGLFRYPCGT